jgi:hypothetical protein
VASFGQAPGWSKARNAGELHRFGAEVDGRPEHHRPVQVVGVAPDLAERFLAAVRAAVEVELLGGPAVARLDQEHGGIARLLDAVERNGARRGRHKGGCAGDDRHGQG